MRTNTVKYQVVKVLGLRIYNVKKRELLCHSDGLNHAQNRVPFSGDLRQVNSSVQSCSTFGSKNGLLAVYAPPSTLGGCALALHYANVIIVIEKLLSYPRNGNCRVLIFSNEYILDVEILNMCR
ncbi:hypothetical protein SESBI_12152 [Sesbania bispinosa]|nr:hypothetical protein SESBI_12152 [Sesbania bispinosa]